VNLEAVLRELAHRSGLRIADKANKLPRERQVGRKWMWWEQARQTYHSGVVDEEVEGQCSLGERGGKVSDRVQRRQVQFHEVEHVVPRFCLVASVGQRRR
jgi:hypothetical protein